MEEERGARQAINLDHEKRLMLLEVDVRDLTDEFGKRGRVTVLEATVESMSPHVDELLLAKRVAAEIKRDRDASGLNRWTKVGIGFGVVSGIGAFIIAIVQAWPG